jgi:nicotinamidase-related amidase
LSLKVKVPATGRTKALIVVDVQSLFMNDDVIKIPGRIASLIDQVPYDYYVETLFHAESGSIWDKQMQWTGPKPNTARIKSVDEISAALADKDAFYVEKTTRSAFIGNTVLRDFLQKRSVTEVHIVGLDTSDCVLATAHDAFDEGFISYVIEECCEVADNRTLHEAALQILRYGKLTNNSCLENVPTTHINLV